MALENPPSSKPEGEQQKSQEQAPNTAHASTEPLHDYFHSKTKFVNWLCTCVIGFACLTVALGAHHVYSHGLEVGEKAEKDLVATHSAIIIDRKSTAEAKQKARLSIVPVFVKTEAGDPKALQSVKEVFGEIAEMQKEGVAPIAEVAAQDLQGVLTAADAEYPAKLSAALAKPAAKKASPQKLQGQIGEMKDHYRVFKKSHPEMSEDKLFIGLSIAPADWKAYESTINNAAQRVCKVFHRLPLEDNSIWVETVFEFLPDSWSPPIRKASSRVMCSVLEPNVEINKLATEAKSQKAAESVQPVMKEVRAGSIIVAKNGVITKDNIELLSEMGYGEINSWPLVWTLAASLGAACFLVALFLYEFEPKHLFSSSSVGMIFTLATITTVLAVIFGKTYPYFVPLPAVALILTIFYGQTVATSVVIPIAIFFAVDKLVDFNNLVALGTASGAAIGFYPKRRHALMSTGLMIGVMQLCGFGAACALTHTMMPAALLGKTLGFEFLGGIACAVAAIGLLPFLENTFGLVTPFRLAELTDADQPLLRKLQENAPGTYQHSLAVANLAEAGAHSIGANVNLVRAGAYYHDVGKMVRPRYFIENQLGAQNPHDTMTPEQSRERVLAHVTDGIELAKEYGLPQAVRDFIPMHQGTTLMAYFYHKACVRDGVDNVDPMAYRYPGPKPHSKETSIVMLADVSEAVTHSMKDPSQAEVETAITKVFQNRWDDGQLAESSLTYTELQKVKQAFVHVWRTLHHERLKYPSTTTGRMAVPPPREEATSPLTDYSNSSENKES